ncbi:sigma-70 family RNA polymerase sigma factor [Rhizobium sp. KVB221]|uniref:Sigma-70 family RNA polymerase sigma factor n=1 Tax=Rhizobium setariae TaxID=2801340 RepID=A0A937CLG8_9HYPH|nr:sigma-70 family RNA polymerase sigma factor [Rhizobium setariae]MBL0373175.1 sigma-70 family RNA polymerase sigma factor [Rhizobium setariae]
MEPELIRRASHGDRLAFGQLVEMHYDFIHAAAWKWTRNRADAEDVAQDVCVRLANAIRGFRGEGRFRTWLYTLVLNAVRDLARKSQRDRRNAAEWSLDPSMHSEPMHEEDMQELWTAVQTLSPKQRDAVMLVYAEGLGHGEAADVLGCSESTVSWHLHEARKRLRTILGREVA